MNTLNELKCTFPARSENERFARTMVCAFAAQLDPTVEDLADLRTAVSEAVTNSIVHAYRGKENGIIPDFSIKENVIVYRMKFMKRLGIFLDHGRGRAVVGCHSI